MFYSGWCLNLGIQGFSVNSCLLQSPEIQCKWLSFPFLILCTCVSAVSRATCPISTNKIQLRRSFLYHVTTTLTMLSSKLIGGKIRAFKLVVRLSEAEQAMLRKSFYLLDQISTFYQSAYSGYPNTSNFVYTGAVSQNYNQFCVSANQSEGTSTSHFVPHVTAAGENANVSHASGNNNNACDNLSSPTNSADITCPLHPLHYANKNSI